MSKKLHILFLCGWYPSRANRNNGDFIQRHAEAVSLDNTVSVLHIVTDKNYLQNIEYSFDIINGVNTHIAYIKPTTNPIIKGIRFYKAFKSLIKKIGSIDVTHLNEVYPFGIFSLYLKWFKKFPFIISEHWTGYHLPQSKNLSFLQKFITKIIIKNANFVCPVSNDLKKSMQFLGFNGKYKKVPNVVNTKLFHPKKIENKIFTITHVSNMVNNHKNIKGMLRVVKKLENEIDNFVFKFIGENSSNYKPYAEKIGVNLSKVVFINHVSHNEVAKILKEANLFVLFSNYENLPCVILESFSCGVPVIATDVGGIYEYFPSEFGYLIQKGDETALLKAIINIYKNPVNLKNRMQNYAKENFSRQSISSQFTELYKQTLN